jgi:transcriptional regulator with XRE-family HTH domain
LISGGGFVQVETLPAHCRSKDGYMSDQAADKTADADLVPGQRPAPDPVATSDAAEEPVRLRPRTAYRLAKNLSYDQAATAYETMRGTFPAGANGGRTEMSADLLRQYEQWPNGGAQPSALTLTWLAQLYGAEPQDLLDERDREMLPSADLTLLSQKTSADSSSGTSLADSLIGQATAALAFAAAVIYAAGGLSLGLKLWFMKVPWTPVLGQIPRDLIIVTAVGQVVLPCLIAGAGVGGLIDWLSVAPAASRHPAGGPLARCRSGLRKHYWQADPIPFLLCTTGVAIVVGAALGLVPLMILALTESSLRPGVLQFKPAIFGVCALLSVVAVFAALAAMRNLYGRSASTGRMAGMIWRRGSVCALASLALVPLFCSVSGSFLLPPVHLCGQNFLHLQEKNGKVVVVNGKVVQQRGYMAGNLIGTNSQWVYIAQFQFNSKNTAYATTITAVPESSVDLQAIGRTANCGDLVEK